MAEQYYGDLAIIAMNGCEKFAQEVNDYIRTWRKDPEGTSYIINCATPRFGSGEAKGIINDTVRGKDVFIIVDVFNYGVTYKLYGKPTPYSPDDHYQDVKRIIGAIGGKARRINVIMPMLYEGRQHKRSARESLDCAMMLQELVSIGVSDIITFDAHDPRVNNAIPLSGFENCRTTYQMIKALVREYPEIEVDSDSTVVISPDEGGMGKCIYYATMMGVELGMFYKRRNYTIIVNGKNPIEAHEYLGRSVRGKDVIVIDDMISSGESVIDVAEQLKEKGAARIFIFATFGLFTAGFEALDKAYENGVFTRIFTTNLIYQPEELFTKKWYASVNMCKQVAYITDALNKDATISHILDQSKKIHDLLSTHKKKQ